MVIFSTDIEEVMFSRQIYTALDLVGDVGGLTDGLRIICYIIIFAFNQFNYVTTLVSKIFTLSVLPSKSMADSISGKVFSQSI